MTTNKRILCDCGQPATRYKYAWICERCARLESERDSLAQRRSGCTLHNEKLLLSVSAACDRFFERNGLSYKYNP